MASPEHPTRETSPVEPHDRSFGTVVTGLILIAIGAVWLLGALDIVEVRLALVLPLALCVVGLALIIGAFRGRHPGLVGLGIFLTVATLLVSFLPDTFGGGIGDRTERVTVESELADEYDLLLGALTLDLSDLDMTRSAEIEVSVFLGEIRVILPDDVPYRVDASVGAGEIRVADEEAEGVAPDLHYTSPGFDTASVTLTLDITVGAGEIEVTR